MASTVTPVNAVRLKAIHSNQAQLKYSKYNKKKEEIQGELFLIDIN